MFKCSAPYEASKNTEEGPVIKRLRQLETLLLETKAQITELKNLQSQAGLTDQSVARLPAINVTDEAAASNLETQLRSQTNGLDIPSVKDWAHLWLLWWLPHEKVHLFKPLSEWPQSDRARAGITRSWYSVAKLLGEDLAMFANMMGSQTSAAGTKRFYLFSAVTTSSITEVPGVLIVTQRSPFRCWLLSSEKIAKAAETALAEQSHCLTTLRIYSYAYVPFSLNTSFLV
ncbi:hypothetical protein L914_20114 [Phytophthora nicotianae]|uniref:Uncharacterized protein n=2 Tax=Phytophthora nicotianae TaxID=4792 RepID=W2M817_PHYNI|nr:hypothetical protein L914_20114 [Phytophthora nicotianae]